MTGTRPAPTGRWPRGAAALGLLAALLLAGRPAAGAEAPFVEPAPVSAGIVYGDGRPAERVEILAGGENRWISAADLSALLEAPRFWRSDIRRLLVRIGAHSVVLVVDSEVALVDDDRPVHLSAPVLYRRGQVWVPLDILVGPDGHQPEWIADRILWDEGRHELQVGEPAGRLTAIRLEGVDRERLDLVVEGEWDYRLVAADRNGFVLRLLGLGFNPDSLLVPGGAPRFLSLAAEPFPGGVEVRFAVAPDMVGYQVFRLDRPRRLSILLSDDLADLRDGRLVPFVDADAPGAGFLRADIDTIIIDPGHGGGDRGARRKGVAEADLMLSLAREVATRLSEQLGVTALLTRDEDRELSTSDRVSLANGSGADLMISLHCDTHPSPAVAGPRAVVARYETGSGNPVPPDLRDLGFQAWGQAQRDQLPRAYVLADRLAAEVAGALGVPSRGVEEWPLPLLTAAAMPAVFLEIDALTAPGAERRLGDSERRSAVASAIVRAVDRYRREAP